MKKFLVIFLTLQFFTNHEAFAEVIKLPFLFHHYNETASNTAFIDFIKTHYSDNKHEESDHDHGKLPFKHSHDGCTNHPSPNISVVIKVDNQYSLKPVALESQNILPSNDQITSTFINSIWQPPKLG